MCEDEKYMVMIKDFNGWKKEEGKVSGMWGWYWKRIGRMCISTSIFRWNLPSKCPSFWQKCNIQWPKKLFIHVIYMNVIALDLKQVIFILNMAQAHFSPRGHKYMFVTP